MAGLPSVDLAFLAAVAGRSEMGAGTWIEAAAPLLRLVPEFAFGFRSVSRTLSRRSASFLGDGSLGSLALSSSWLMKPSSGCQTMRRFEGVPTGSSLSESPSMLMSMSLFPRRLGVSDSVSSMTLPPAMEDVVIGSSADIPRLRRTIGLMPGSVLEARYSRIISSPSEGVEGAARLMPFQLRRPGVPSRARTGEYAAEGAGDAVRRPTLPALDVRPGVPESVKRPALRGGRLRRAAALRAES